MELDKFIKKMMAYGTSKYNLHYDEYVIFGCRGYTVSNYELVKNDDKIDTFNDSLFLLKGQKEVGFQSQYYRCTMDPGLTWLRKAMNPLGTARTKEGLYKYKLGDHKGHEALVQASTITVDRYEQKTNWGFWKEEKPKVTETGWFAVNIHAKSSNSSSVGAASAGCTVIDGDWNSGEWNSFITLIKASKQPVFCYVVLNQDTVESLIKS